MLSAPLQYRAWLDERRHPYMEANLFKYIWQHSKKEQGLVLLLVLASLPFYFLSLQLPKLIVNQGIQGEGFEGPESTQPFLRIQLPSLGMVRDESIRLFDGIQLEQSGLLLALSFSFLAMVIVNGLFKLNINTMKGRLGERMLRRLRFALTDRILRFPLPQLRKMKQAEMATMIKDEVEPLGGFIGDAFVTPVFLGGQALTAMAFIFIQSISLGLVAAAIALLQAFLIPRLRVRILQLGRERQLTARILAGRIAEIVDGATEIHVHDTSNFERSDIASRLGRIFGIRFEIYQRKFMVKFVNNFLSQVTPFLFYAVGGILAIRGQLDIGALVAVINAYKDLPGPIKELIDWDQQRNDVQIKYEQVSEQFQPATIMDPALQAYSIDAGSRLKGKIEVASVTLTDDGDVRLLDSVSFSAPMDEHIAIVGPSGGGKEYLAQLLARLVWPTSGTIKIGGRDLSKLPEAVTGRRLSYVGQDAYLFPLSVQDNLLYGLKHQPLKPVSYSGEAAERRAREEIESRRAGNITFDVNADWIDYDAAGARGSEDISDRLIEAMQLTELEDDVYRFGLGRSVDPEAWPQVTVSLLRARAALREKLENMGADDLVVRFDPAKYNPNATLAENLLFGTPTKAEYRADRLADNAMLLTALDEVDLVDDLLRMGSTIAKTMVEIFADLPPGHPFFEQFSFIQFDDLPDFRTLIGRVEKAGQQSLSPVDRRKLMGLPFNYVEARHRLGLIDEQVEAKVLEARSLFAMRITQEQSGAVQFYQPDVYNAAASIQDNILFGRLAYGRAHAEDTVGQAITEVVDELGLRKIVVEAGLGFHVGVAGKRLSAVQRQKLALTRALVKRPDLLIINEALAIMDATTQSRVMDRVLEVRRGRGVIWTLARPEEAQRFDRVLVIRGGRLVGQGAVSDLNRSGSALNQMMTGT